MGGFGVVWNLYGDFYEFVNYIRLVLICVVIWIVRFFDRMGVFIVF